MSKSAKEILRDDVKEIVDGVIDKFPLRIDHFLKPYANKLVNSIVEVSNKFVEAKIKEQNEQD